MPVVNLTDRFCLNAKASKGRVDYFDEKTRGLALRVTPSGVKTFTLHYGPAKKRGRLTLGRYPRISLARARTLALEALGKVVDGEDPRRSASATIRDLWDAYLAQHVTPNLRSAAAVKRRVTKNVLPEIGDKPLHELHKRDITAAITPILNRGKQVEAARVFEDIRGMLRWGTAQGHLDHNPADGMRKPEARPPRERTLTDAEIKKLWSGLPKALPRSTTVQNIIRLALMTGQRVGEIAGITEAEIDAKARLWTIPASRSKNGHAHTVPLTKAAMAVVGEIIAGEKVPGHAVAKTVRLAQDRFALDEPWTMHDLRRTVVTKMAALGVSPIVLGHVINHRSVTRAGVTLAVYSQYDYATEKKQALDLWAKKLTSIVRS